MKRLPTIGAEYEKNEKENMTRLSYEVEKLGHFKIKLDPQSFLDLNNKIKDKKIII